MNTKISTPVNAGVDKPTSSGRLFFLDNGAGRVLTANPDGSDLRTLIDEGRKGPDGVVVDVLAAVLSSLTSADAQRWYRHAIDEFR